MSIIGAIVGLYLSIWWIMAILCYFLRCYNSAIFSVPIVKAYLQISYKRQLIGMMKLVYHGLRTDLGSLRPLYMFLYPLLALASFAFLLVMFSVFRRFDWVFVGKTMQPNASAILFCTQKKKCSINYWEYFFLLIKIAMITHLQYWKNE